MTQALRACGTEIMLGLFMAVSVSTIINLPLWTSLITTNEWQWDDVVEESADELFYLTRIQEAVDGYRYIGNPALYERRKQSYPLGSLFENVLSLPITIFGWRMKTLSIVADALLPFILALMTWFAFMRPMPDRQWRALALSAIFLGGNIILWKRPISPQAMSVLPILWLWIFLGRKQSSLRSLFVRSMLIGCMVYSYPFHWTYCFMTEVTLWIMTTLKERRMKKALVSILTLALPFMIMTIPWILQSLAVSHDPAYTETLSRLGLIHRRVPVGPFLQLKILCIGLFLWWISRRNDRKEMIAISALLSAGILVLWTPLLTGREAEFSNHYERIIMFPLTLGLMIGIAQYSKKSRIRTRITITLFSLFIIITTWSGVRESFTNFMDTRRQSDERIALNDTLHSLRSLPSESVILTENAFTQLLTTYTSHYPYTSSMAYMYLAPDSEIIERGHIYNQLVPYDTITTRGIFGTRNENKMLYARLKCMLISAIGNKDLQCLERAMYCEECIAFKHLPPLTQSEIIAHLKASHVNYVLLKKVPTFLYSSLQQVKVMPDGRILYSFTPAR